MSKTVQNFYELFSLLYGGYLTNLLILFSYFYKNVIFNCNM